MKKILNPQANTEITRNSFYDIFPEMGKEELARYKRFSGIAPENHYQSILEELEAEESASESNSKSASESNS